MAKRTRYELGFNWFDGRDHPFAHEIALAARRRRIRCLHVAKTQAHRIRRRVDNRTVEVGLFLNTQADYTRFESPMMLLCRSLKASGAMVVEDPDDSRVYTNRVLQFDYLRKAGLTVPKQITIAGWRPGRRALSAAQRARLGKTWMAQPAVGLSQDRFLLSTAQSVSAALARAKFPVGRDVLISPWPRPVTTDDRELTFVVWYLFGLIVPCWSAGGARTLKPVETGDAELECLSNLLNTTKKLASITGLDWFVTEMMVANTGARQSLLVLEPPNALAALGPGVRALANLPASVARTIADRIVEIAWRRAKGLPLSDGHVMLLRSQDSE